MTIYVVKVVRRANRKKLNKLHSIRFFFFVNNIIMWLDQIDGGENEIHIRKKTLAIVRQAIVCLMQLTDICPAARFNPFHQSCCEYMCRFTFVFNSIYRHNTSSTELHTVDCTVCTNANDLCRSLFPGHNRMCR